MRTNGDNSNTLNCSWNIDNVCLSKSVGEITSLCCVADMKFHNTSVSLPGELLGKKTEADLAHVNAYSRDLCSIFNASELFDCSKCSDVLTALIQPLLLT